MCTMTAELECPAAAFLSLAFGWFETYRAVAGLDFVEKTIQGGIFYYSRQEEMSCERYSANDTFVLASLKRVHFPENLTSDAAVDSFKTLYTERKRKRFIFRLSLPVHIFFNTNICVFVCIFRVCVA